MSHLSGGRARWVALGAVTGALAVGGIAWADIPDSGVIDGCYKSNSGAVRVIDTSAGGTCTASEKPLSWSQTGPTGPPGVSGSTGPTGPTEGVGSTAHGLTPPSTLTTQFHIDLTSTFTTTVSGRLHLSKPFFAALDCENDVSVVWWWITLDGTPVRSSLAMTFQDVRTAQTLVGVTNSVITAGTHTMGVEAMCNSGLGPAATAADHSAGTAIVLG